MRILWYAFLVLATYVSIYPFDFQATSLNQGTLQAFLATCCKMTGRGDIVGNIILFVPIGFAGMLGILMATPTTRRFLGVCAISTVFALALQLVQIYLPSRDESLQDVIWNLVGTAAGAALAVFAGQRMSRIMNVRAGTSVVPVTLIACWLSYRLLPFIPTINYQLIKDSLKPLLQPALLPINIILDATAWLVVAYLLSQLTHGARKDRYLPVLIAAVFCFEVLIVYNSLNASNLAGALAAILIWTGLLRDSRWSANVILLCLFAAIALKGLQPFVASPDANPFNWIPFRGFLGESMYFNAQSAAIKTFLYGSLIYLLWQTRLPRHLGVFGAVVFLGILEFLQIGFIGHTPEITDPLLALCAAFALIALEKYEQQTGMLVPHPLSTPSPARPSALLRWSSAPGRDKWVRQTVNLRSDQFDFLTQLSQEMGVSVSGVTRRIVATFIDELDERKPINYARGQDATMSSNQSEYGDESGHHNLPNRWVTKTVNLRSSQFKFLLRLAKKMEISVSGVTRRIVQTFMDELDAGQRTN